MVAPSGFRQVQVQVPSSFASLISSVASSAVLLRASSHLFLSHSSYLVPTRTFGENRKTLRKDYREWNRLNVTDLSVSSLWGKIVANRKSGKEQKPTLKSSLAPFIP